MSEAPDQAATRRRWVTLAELVAVAGVVIAALTLWSTWSDRRADEAERASAASAAASDRARLSLSGELQGDGARILLRDPQHDIQSLRVTFPPALGVAPQSPAGDPLIEASWVAAPMLKATDGGADDRTGRLPVLLTIRYWDGDRARETQDVYDLVWRTEGRMLRGRSFRLDGIKLRRRGGDPATLGRMWRHP